MDDPSPDVATEKTSSVLLNGNLVPSSEVVKVVARYCLPLLFTRDEEVYDLAYSGSSVLFRHRGHNFQLATKHQLRSGEETLNAADCCIVETDGNGHVALSPNEVSRVSVEGDDLLPQDILLLEFDSLRDTHDLRPRFLDLTETRAFRDVDAASIELVFSVGYPTNAQSLEPNFDENYNTASIHVTSRPRELYFDVESIGPSCEESRETINVDKKYGGDIGDPDGWSGAPIFFTWKDEDHRLHLGFGGMITQGKSTGKFMIYRAEDIRAVVNRAIATPSRSTSNSGA